jgi:hypothetical protein
VNRSKEFRNISTSKVIVFELSKMRSSKSSEQARMAKPSFPLPLFTQNTKVQVYLGAGWSTGYVISSAQDKCVVQLGVGNRSITVYDARSIRRYV